MSNESVRRCADVFLCDFFWVLQKLERGELVAAQHLLHRSLSETNLRLLREVRLRKGELLPSFGLGRKVEKLLRSEQLDRIQIEARLNRDELQLAAWKAFKTLVQFVYELDPTWSVPIGFDGLLTHFR